MLPEPESRRNFVKKSLAASIAAAQPTFFAGLVRATGGDGQTTGGPETTWVYDSTYPWTETTISWPETTVPFLPETTVPFETTVSETTITTYNDGTDYIWKQYKIVRNGGVTVESIESDTEAKAWENFDKQCRQDAVQKAGSSTQDGDSGRVDVTNKTKLNPPDYRVPSTAATQPTLVHLPNGKFKVTYTFPKGLVYRIYYYN